MRNQQFFRKYFRNNFQAVCRLLLLSLLTCSTLLAQYTNLDKGFKPFGSYQLGDLDSVSLNNGNVALHIPVVSYPQRGNLALSFSIFYNNKSWREESFVDGTGAYWQWMPTDTFTGAYFRSDQKTSLEPTQIQLEGSDPPQYHWYYSTITADGSSHLLAPVTGTSYGAVDGSGWHVDAPQTVPVGNPVDRNGIIYADTGDVAKDPDGNTINVGVAEGIGGSSAPWITTLCRLITPPALASDPPRTLSPP